MAPPNASGSSAEFGPSSVPVPVPAPPENPPPLILPRVILRNSLNALVVDAQTVFRMLLKAYLQHCGVETQDVNNGGDAVDLIESGATFDLIFIDILLPTLSGLETTRMLREMGVTARIVGMTNWLTEMDVLAFFDAGVNEVCEKPLSPNTVIRIVTQLDAQR